MTTDRVIRLTNCRLTIGDHLVQQDLWICASTGRIVDAQRCFFERRTGPSVVHDLGGRILAPGFIDTQLNGAFGFDFSVPADEPGKYRANMERVNKQLVKTGVTSYLPTLTSQRAHVYHKTLPYLAARTSRDPSEGAESLGAHCEGPFLSPEKNGIHKKEVLLQLQGGISDLEECYGANNLKSPIIKMVTLAPELDQTQSVIRDLSSRGIIVSAGHSAADYERMRTAVKQGATMVTHLFNAMNQPHHRNPGIFGIVGAEDEFARPYYGIIADDIHVHPSFVKVAHYAHPNGTILVTDAMSLLGLPDGRYDWTNGESIVKHGGKLTLNDTQTIAGSCVTLIECLVNMINWTSSSIPHAIRTVTCTPAKMLGLENVKGTLKPGADADLVVLSEGKGADGKVTLTVDEVWKFGVKVFGQTAAKL